MTIYFFMIFNMLSFIYCSIKYGIEDSQCSKMWTLYICFHIFSLAINGNIATIPYWVVSLLLLYIPKKIVGIFKPSVFIYIGLFFSVGVFFQYLFPNLYNIYVMPLFLAGTLDFIESSITYEFGFSGFSPQTGTTAYLLLVCQSVLMAFKEQGFWGKRPVRILLLVLLVLSIFLTGKRMLSVISIVLLMLYVYISSSRNALKRIILLSLLFIGSYFIIQIFLENLQQYSDNVFLRRFVSSYYSASGGDDISSGRYNLYQKALYIFEKEPILGMGAGNYSKTNGMGTSVHNAYLQVLCEEGILRFPLFIIPLVLVFIKTIREVLNKRVIIGSSFLLLSLFLQIVIILYSFTGNTFVDNNNFVLYFMGVGFFAYAVSVKNQNYRYV